jgi:hypothetical protein
MMATSQPFRRLDCTCNRTKALPFKAMGGMLDVSTFSSSFRAFFYAFFAFFAVFRTSFVFLDIRCGL